MKPAKPIPINGVGRNGRQRPDTVLITGGAGFIGTNLAAALAAQGKKVHLYDNLARPGSAWNLRWLKRLYPERVEVTIGSVCDAESLQPLVNASGCVFHFAAQVAVTTSLMDPWSDFATNAAGTINVLEACRRRRHPPAVLFTSTNKVYGDLGDLDMTLQGRRYQPADAQIRRHGISERRPLSFHSPYGCSKGSADQYVLDYARCFGLPAVVFRMSCIYGPHQFGNEDQGWLAHFIRAVLAKERLTLYGDGCQVRDLLFVDDLIAAMLEAVRRIDVTGGRAFNVGGGPRNARSLLEVVDQITHLHGPMMPLRHDAWRTGDQKYYVSDTRALQQAIGWKPQVSAEQGIERLYQWLQEHARPSVSTSALA